MSIPLFNVRMLLEMLKIARVLMKMRQYHNIAVLLCSENYKYSKYSKKLVL